MKGKIAQLMLHDNGCDRVLSTSRLGESSKIFVMQMGVIWGLFFQDLQITPY